MTTWLLVHSPLLGPASWSAVAAELWDAGDTVLVPDLRPALSGGPGYAQRQAELAVQVAPPTSVVVAGHSGAGPLLPLISEAASAAGVLVPRCLFVDAGLPHPGRARRSTLPAGLAAHLDSLSQDGWLPPWPRWWPPGALDELLPDPATRAVLEDDAPRLPAALFDEPLPPVDALPPAGYLQLSDAYGEPAAEAAAAGWPLRRLRSDHLAPLTRPCEVVRAMRGLLSDTSSTPMAC